MQAKARIPKAIQPHCVLLVSASSWLAAAAPAAAAAPGRTTATADVCVTVVVSVCETVTVSAGSTLSIVSPGTVSVSVSAGKGDRCRVFRGCLGRSGARERYRDSVQARSPPALRNQHDGGEQPEQPEDRGDGHLRRDAHRLGATAAHWLFPHDPSVQHLEVGRRPAEAGLCQVRQPLAREARTVDPTGSRDARQAALTLVAARSTNQEGTSNEETDHDHARLPERRRRRCGSELRRQARRDQQFPRRVGEQHERECRTRAGARIAPSMRARGFFGGNMDIKQSFPT